MLHDNEHDHAEGEHRQTPERLPFTLPDFTRHSWVSEAARRTWEPRLERVRRAWSDTEWLSVIGGVRLCALVGIPKDALSATVTRWSAHGLSALGVPMAQPELRPDMVFVLVGNLLDITRAQKAWTERADDALGTLLGYPACCRKAFAEVWTEHQCLDTTWSMAASTAAPNNNLVMLENPASLANILWRWVGVRAVPHLPCRFDCSESMEFAHRMLRVADQGGYAEEVCWIREILSWPVEWSALHGIAEVKTPILKFMTRTDATARKRVVRWTGSQYPQEGATGLHFPYQNPSRRPLALTKSSQAALEQPIGTVELDRSWLHRDNGFISSEAMQELHAPIASAARKILEGTAGNVLDLGCGNGVLLSAICAGRAECVPFGVDKNSKALQHAGELLPQFARNFTSADIFDCDRWDTGPRYALTVLMLGRLLEVDRVTASQFLQRIKAVSDAILVYVYPDRAEVPLRSLAQSMGLRLHDSPHLAVALLNTRDADEVIDWLRLAEPQSDQYDTNIILRLASMGTTAGRPQPYRRAPVGDFPLIFDDQVAVRPVYRGMAEFGALSEHYLDAPLDHPNIATATQYVRRWPAMYEQCKRLLEAVHPAIDARIPFESDEIYRGSTCHSFERLFGTLWSTIHCPIGLAEAMVHELAHQKLRALGVSFESATAIVANDPAELHVSPIVKDRLRPMSAVLHAQYSYVHVTALDVHIISAESDPARRARLRQVLNKNLLRIGEGRQTIQRHLVLGLHGTAFMQGFDRWTQSTMDSAAGMLGAT